jgi:hypothetical protein
MQETFYATFAAIAFTLLGLWWVVVQFKYQSWMSDPQRRQMAYNVSLYFILPGIMSLVSLLSGEAKFLWRGAFAIAGIFGAVEAVRMAMGSAQNRSRWAIVGRWFAVVLYALVVVVAVNPEMIQALGIPLKAIESEGVMLSIILFIGVNFAWMMFTEPES